VLPIRSVNAARRNGGRQALPHLRGSNNQLSWLLNLRSKRLSSSASTLVDRAERARASRHWIRLGKERGPSA